MAKRRFVQNSDTGELIEISQDYQPETRAQAHDGLLWNDRLYDGVRATDGADISSRAKHKEYMKRNNLTTIDDYKETWAKAEKKREDYRTAGKGGAVDREAVGRAIAELERVRSNHRR